MPPPCGIRRRCAAHLRNSGVNGSELPHKNSLNTCIMKRKFRYNYGTCAVQLYDRMKVQPPVFRTIADAYNHFVRHPEESQITDNPDGFELGNGLDDYFDRLESLQAGLDAQASRKAAKSQPSKSAEPPSDEPDELTDDTPGDPS